MMSLNANDAKARADRVNEGCLDDIYKQISDACAHGKYKCYTKRMLLDNEIQTLQQLGYKIDIIEDNRSPLHCCIKWGTHNGK